MAHDVLIAGALFPDVPSVQFPDSQQQWHSFTDVSDTTAAASDVAQGKVFYDASGVLTQGTASGGGGGAPKIGVLRPDAELWKTYTYDKLLVEDEGITIPAYNTSNQTVKASATIATIDDTDWTSYRYFVVVRCLTIPKYKAGTTVGKGMQLYHALASTTDFSYVRPDQFIPAGIPTGAGSYFTAASGFVPMILVYYSSATNTYASTGTSGAAYGCYQNNFSVSSSGSRITLSSPRFNMRGSTTQLSSTYWAAIEDIRFQYRFEVYRVANGGPYFDGYTVQSNFAKTLSCAISASGDLT